MRRQPKQSSKKRPRFSGKTPFISVRPPKGMRWVVGRHAVNEALKVRPQSVRQCLVERGLITRLDRDVLDRLKQAHVEPTPCDSSQIDPIATSHQGMAILVEDGPRLDPSDLEKDRSLIVVLDGLEDPHNLGAILRTSWLTSADAIVVPERRSAQLTASVAKIACGGAEHVPVHVESDLIGFLRSLKDKGYWVFGLAGEAEKSLWETQYPEKTVWLVGSESSGLRRSLRKECDEVIKIPQIDAAASYNASVAAAMALYETARQRENP